MAENTAPEVRERIWIEKYDHSTDPPVKVETVFIENGVVRDVVRHGEREGEQPAKPAE